MKETCPSGNIQKTINWNARAWVALLMGAAMALLMIGFRWGMYKGSGKKLTDVVAAIVIFGGSL